MSDETEQPAAPKIVSFELDIPLDFVIRAYMSAVLEHHKGNRRAAAESLGVSLKTMYNRIPAEGSK